MTSLMNGEAAPILRCPTHRLRIACSILGLIAFLALGASPARADYGIESFSTTFLDSAGSPTTQAAGHPNLTVEFHVNQTVDSHGTRADDGQTRMTITDLPNGLYGNPQAIPQCPAALLAPGGPTFCPADTQIGTFGLSVAPGFFYTQPLYNLVPGPNQAAAFGANYLYTPVGLVSTVTEEHGAPLVRTTVTDASQALSYEAIKVVLWGVPSDPAHNSERAGFLPSGLTRQPFLTMPSDCSQPMVTYLAVASWQQPDNFIEASDEEPAPTGCESLELKHAISVSPTESRANTPSGIDIGLDVPQSDAADGVGTPPLRRVQVDFPAGVTLSPTAADGLEGCSDAQLHAGSDVAPKCPDASRIGNVTVDTPLLAKDLSGSVYVGTSTASETFRVFVVLEGPGVLLKLPGVVEADPDSGQLTAVFDDLPELPFSSMQMHLKGGANAALATPKCGAYATTSELTAWSGQVSRNTSTMTIDSGCGQASKFEPSLTAGLTNPVAGGPTAFSLRLTRPSGQQAIRTLDVSLPPGVLAKVGSVPLCPEPQAAAGTCSPASKIGTTTVGAGDGTSPVFVPQPGKASTAVYLAGPYKGAPYSLSVVVPAQAGPYDLGTVVVRSALRVDPLTAQVTVQSDPIPTILKGVPVRIQDLRVDIDRPGFIVAPTNCSPMKVTSTVTSAEGTVAHPSSRFQIGNCSDLGFKPSLSLKFKGGTKRSDNPAVTAVLKAPKGEANIARTSVILPNSEFIDNAHISNPCTRVQFNENACPKGSILGTATAYTSLLNEPLSGPVYFRSNGGDRELPDLVVDLNGSIHVTLVGFIDSVNGRVRTRFQSVPDAPVSKFVLKLKGGDKGLIENSRNLCSFTPKASVKMTGQNGKHHDFAAKIGTSCGKKKSSGRRRG